jgi:hypothetical protein
MRCSVLWIGAAASLSLAGCAPKVDDAANPPQLGNWTVTTALESFTINGMNLSASTLADMDEDSGSAGGLISRAAGNDERRCVEPRLSNDDALLGLFHTSLRDCEATESTVSDTTRHLVMRCRHRDKNVTVTIDASFEGTSGYANLRLTQSEIKTSGATSSLGLGLRATLTRTGDCG